MAERFWGGVEVVSPVTVTEEVAVEVPVPFVAVRVYIVVEVGERMRDPTSVLVEKEPGVMATDEAFVRSQESVDDAPETMDAGEDVKEKMVGLEVACVMSGSPAPASK